MSEKAIIEYVNILCSSKITSLEELSSGEIFCQLISLVEPSKIDKSKMQAVDTWIQKLSNLKLAAKYLMVEYEEEFNNKPPLDFDLLKIAKYSDHKEITKLFEAMLFIFLNCQNKDQFIKKIMEMGEEHQHQMMDTVRKLIDSNPDQQPEQFSQKENNQQGKLLEKVDELEHEIQILRSENNALQQQAAQEHKENQLLSQEIAKLNKSITSLNSQIINQQSKQYKNDILYNNSLIESLKQKLITESVEHQKQKMRMNQQIELMRAKVDKTDALQNNLQNYARNYLIKCKRVEQLETELYHTQQTLDRKNKLIESLEQKWKILEEKIAKGQLEKIQFQVELEKQNLRNLKNGEFKKALGIESNRSDPLLEYQSKRQSEEQLQIANRRIKILQKDLAKASLKAQKTTKLESDISQLQETFIVEMNSKKQQIELLSSALIEIRRMYSDFKVVKVE